MSTSLADAPSAEWTVLTLFKALACLTWMLLIARKAIVIRRYNHRREIAEQTSTVIDFSMQSNVTWAWNRLASLIIAKPAVPVNGPQQPDKKEQKQLSGVHDKYNQLVVESSDPIRPEDRLLFSLLRRTAWQCTDKEPNWNSCSQIIPSKPSRVSVLLSSTASSCTSRTTLPTATAMLTHRHLSIPSHRNPSGAAALVAIVPVSVLAIQTYFSASSSDTSSRKVSPLQSSHIGVMSRLLKLITNGFCTRKTTRNNRVGVAVEGDPAKAWSRPSRLQPSIIPSLEERPSFIDSSIKANWPCIQMSNSQPLVIIFNPLLIVYKSGLKKKENRRVLIDFWITKDEYSIAGQVRLPTTSKKRSAKNC